MRSAVIIFVLGLLMLACSSDAADVEPGQSAPGSPVEPAAPTSSVVVSDEVPSLQELRDSGLSGQQAECFVREIDPDGTGRVQNAELFMTAMANCL